MNIIMRLIYMMFFVFISNSNAELVHDIALDPFGFHDYDITSLIKDHPYVFKTIVLDTKKVQEHELKNLNLKRDNSKRSVFKSKIYVLELYKGIIKKETRLLYYYAKEKHYSDNKTSNTAIPARQVFIIATHQLTNKILPEFTPYKNIIPVINVEHTFFDPEKIGQEFNSQFFLRDIGFKCYTQEQATEKASQALESENISFASLYSFDVTKKETIWKLDGRIGPKLIPFAEICIEVSKFSCEYHACDKSFPGDKIQVLDYAM